MDNLDFAKHLQKVYSDQGARHVFVDNDGCAFGVGDLLFHGHRESVTCYAINRDEALQALVKYSEKESKWILWAADVEAGCCITAGSNFISPLNVSEQEVEGLSKYSVWLEAELNLNAAKFLGEWDAVSFERACYKAVSFHYPGDISYYNSDDLTFWGLRFFDHDPILETVECVLNKIDAFIISIIGESYYKEECYYKEVVKPLRKSNNYLTLYGQDYYIRDIAKNLIKFWLLKGFNFVIFENNKPILFKQYKNYHALEPVFIDSDLGHKAVLAWLEGCWHYV